jgi:hypothetical protein
MTSRIAAISVDALLSSEGGIDLRQHAPQNRFARCRCSIDQFVAVANAEVEVCEQPTVHAFLGAIRRLVDQPSHDGGHRIKFNVAGEGVM